MEIGDRYISENEKVFAEIVEINRDIVDVDVFETKTEIYLHGNTFNIDRFREVFPNKINVTNYDKQKQKLKV